MSTRVESPRIAALAMEIGLGAVFVILLMVTGYALADSWGGGYWLFGLVIGAAGGAIALLRRRHRLVAAVAGLAVAAVAVSTAWVADLPSEPSPALALALAVLLGSAVRTLPLPVAGAVTAGFLLVVVGAWLAHGPGSVAMLNAALWFAALVLGLLLRLVDGWEQSTAERVRRNERLQLARELHDEVAHHISGIVLQSQAAQLAASKDPAILGDSLAGIETAGSRALAATRQVVGVLRDTDDAAPGRPGPQWRCSPGRATRRSRYATTAHRRRSATHTVPGTVCSGCGNGWNRLAAPSPPGRPTGVAGRCGPACRCQTRRTDDDPMTIRVLIADDQAMVRGGLRMILEDQPDLTVVAEAADGVEAIAIARRVRPDVCLVDVRMPRLDGIEVTRALAGPGVVNPLRVVVVTTFDLDEYVYGALRGGAVGFVLKDAGPALLVEAVRAAHAGEALISPAVTLRLLRNLAPVKPIRGKSAVRPLSDRELDVVRQIAWGRTNQEIAAELFISLSTVKSHLSAIQSKLEVRNRVGIAAWAWENRIVEGG